MPTLSVDDSASTLTTMPVMRGPASALITGTGAGILGFDPVPETVTPLPVVPLLLPLLEDEPDFEEPPEVDEPLPVEELLVVVDPLVPDELLLDELLLDELLLDELLLDELLLDELLLDEPAVDPFELVDPVLPPVPEELEPPDDDPDEVPEVDVVVPVFLP